MCGSDATHALLEIPSVPVFCNVLWERAEEARGAAWGTMRLAFCPSCAHTFNSAYDPALTEYAQSYDNSLHYSARFNRYAAELAARLVERYNVRGKSVVEIGCGKGDFLLMLSEQGDNRAWGFDRSFDPSRVEPSRRDRIHFVQDFYTPARAAELAPDLVCCRHVLEHIADPRAFLDDLYRGLEGRADAVLYVEVPNALYTLAHRGIWDVIYEHCGYFTLSSLTRAAGQSGFDVIEAGESFDGQFIYIEARPGKGEVRRVVPAAHLPAAVRDHASAFASSFREKLQTWQASVARLRADGRRAAVWGGGSKGVTFLNLMGRDSGIEYVVDLNPHKQGKHVAGTGQQIVAPEFLRTYRPSDVIIMNGIYLDEISRLLEAFGVEASLTCA